MASSDSAAARPDALGMSNLSRPAVVPFLPAPLRRAANSGIAGLELRLETVDGGPAPAMERWVTRQAEISAGALALWLGLRR